MTTEWLFRDDAYLREASARVLRVDEGGVVLDRTIFYAQGGGQAGDTGVLVRRNGERVGVRDTRKGEGDAVVHLVDGPAQLAPGEEVALAIDWDRRYRLMRLHTALHLLSCVVVAPVTGGNIAPDKARLDFDIDMSLLDAARIERETNALIEKAIATETVWISDEELDARPELVKTMSVKPPRGAGRVSPKGRPEGESGAEARSAEAGLIRPKGRPEGESGAEARSAEAGLIRLLRIPGIDLQPCGGTHVANIGEIGAIRVVKIRSEGRRNRRVEIALA